MTTRNKANMDAAKVEKDDEFYTRRVDIDMDLARYPGQFEGKAVYCNCDDPQWSEFVNYFTENFRRLGLRRLVATHYAEPQLDLFSPPSPPPLMLDWDGAGKPRLRRLRGSGSFDSPECIQLLGECDVVVTNPPFSLFRRYLSMLMDHGKDFLIIGNMAAMCYRDVWPLVKSGRIRLGLKNRPCIFLKNRTGEEVRVNACWFTTLDSDIVRSGVTPIPAEECEELVEYDNYRAVEVSNMRRIPAGYDGVVGVPVSYIFHHRDEEFEILGLSTEGVGGGIDEIIKPEYRGDFRVPSLRGRLTYNRLFIRRRGVEGQ